VGIDLCWRRVCVLVNQTTGEPLAARIRVCDTFWKKLRGLMFRRPLDPDEAYLFMCRRESVGEATIHMFFVFSSIAVLWLDARKRVVDTALARPFRPYYAPRRAALYYVECVPEVIDRVHLGDELAF
jgi:uncharacterized membrane protein (UPF0127 family)